MALGWSNSPTSWRRSIGSCVANGWPFDQAPTSSRSSARQRSGTAASAIPARALRLSRSKTVVASTWSCSSSAARLSGCSSRATSICGGRSAGAGVAGAAAACGGGGSPMRRQGGRRRMPPSGGPCAERTTRPWSAARSIWRSSACSALSTASVSRAARASGVSAATAAARVARHRGRRRRAPGSARRRRRC